MPYNILYMYVLVLLHFTAPPKVAEKPLRIDPDRLSFKEKLQLHSKVASEQTTSVMSPLCPSSARESYKRPTTPESDVSRVSELAKTQSPADTTAGIIRVMDMYNVCILFLFSLGYILWCNSMYDIVHINLHFVFLESDTLVPTLTEEQLSAEERRLNRFVNRPAKV